MNLTNDIILRVLGLSISIYTILYLEGTLPVKLFYGFIFIGIFLMLKGESIQEID